MSYRITELLVLTLIILWILISGRRRTRRGNLKRSDQLLPLQAFSDPAQFTRRRSVRQVGDVQQERLQIVERLLSRQIAFHLSVAAQQNVLIKQPARQLFLVIQINRRASSGSFRDISVAKRAQHQLRFLEMPDRFRREERGGDQRLIGSS